MSNDDSRSRRATTRNLETALTTIDDIAKAHNISSDTRGTATRLYQQILQEHSTLYGWDIETAACACLYLACKIEQEAISPRELTADTDVQKKILLRRAKQIRTELGLDFVDIVDPYQYIEEYANDLEASDAVLERAEEILDHISDTHLVSGRNPRAVAAAAIYNAGLDTSEKMTQATIAGVADVSEVTIRNRYQEQQEYMNENS